ncbi:MAG TPA: arsenosugar biosynthesis radical SAM (seleno)protein ArsS [Polyangia bacterium]|nr:arsenosugar biosynthesis radical SAM (seleno)protein ArsS [Polyangia bacterium]
MSTACADFDRTLDQHGLPPLQASAPTTFQVNVGKRCNQACHHCHVDASPRRTEMMQRAVAERVVALIEASPVVEVVDITGGAPELNPNFRFLVQAARALGRRVIDRCNLTILFEAGQEDLAEFLAAERVDVVASLPCYLAENVDKQRGRGVFDKSMLALARLNALGYGRPGSPLGLDLVYNPVGAYLPPPQDQLEAQYKEQLRARFGIEFHRLFTLTNMPIKRFAEQLAREGKSAEYMSLLINHFNPQAVAHVMCRSLVSVGWEGTLYDCDFNQMLEIPLAGPRRTLWDIESVDQLGGRGIATAFHCFGCTAGAGSSCGGALV